MKQKLETALLLFLFLTVTLQLKAQFNYLPVKKGNEQIVKHKYYSLSYNENWEQASWVAYELNPQTISGTTKRSNNFRTDPMVSSRSASLKDYSKSGYDRGHLLPAASMKFSKEAMSETFYMSNMSPQKPYFNRGIWKKLEAQVRSWVNRYGKLYVVTGPIIKQTEQKIGPNKVIVPQAYYKVIWNPKQKKGIAFLLKNEKSSEPLSHFAVSIDKVEQETGIDFFPALPDPLEEEIEKQYQKAAWF
ncbi:MAG: DNA/RNA non-specific endonuclease [Marinifilaceae bacterium]